MNARPTMSGFKVSVLPGNDAASITVRVSPTLSGLVRMWLAPRLVRLGVLCIEAGARILPGNLAPHFDVTWRERPR